MWEEISKYRVLLNLHVNNYHKVRQYSVNCYDCGKNLQRKVIYGTTNHVSIERECQMKEYQLWVDTCPCSHLYSLYSRETTGGQDSLPNISLIEPVHPSPIYPTLSPSLSTPPIPTHSLCQSPLSHPMMRWYSWIVMCPLIVLCKVIPWMIPWIIVMIA